MKNAAVTFVYNETFSLPLWIRYFGAQFGRENLFVVDLGTNDGSTNDLGIVNKIAMPRDDLDEYTRTNFINCLQQGLLNYYDTVVYSDADELVVPDPELYPNLRVYLEQRTFDYASCVGLNIVHMLNLEEPIDLTRPILQQRRFAKFQSATCKSCVSRVPMNWSPGFHCGDKPPKIDPALFLFHTKWMDYTLAMQRQKVSREATYSMRTLAQGMRAHSRYDHDRFVREGFFDPINEMIHRGLAEFDFSVEIEAITANTAAASGVHFIPMNISKLVAIPERFGLMF